MAPGASGRGGRIDSGESPVADHWRAVDDAGRVECTLCPRHCRPRPGQVGSCGVRGNLRGSLHTLNYGRSVAATREVIETEAVYHFSPGRPILSLGNIGCMMACDFCQNWQTSQVRHLDPGVARTYTPEGVLDLCEENGIGMISWTYNDPVVWHEFVRDTSRLARARGLRTLYKSAFYIEEPPARELIECIDIFSLSLKSMDERFYRRVTKGELRPVLERIKLVHESGRHLEISQLVIPERNDGIEDIRKTIRWVLDHLGDDVPLHFVGFHPAYRYTHVGRTPLETLLRARAEALAAGVRHCYLGNTYREGVSDTCCGQCGHTLVARYGLTASIVGIAPGGECFSCGHPSPIRFPFETMDRRSASRASSRLDDAGGNHPGGRLTGRTGSRPPGGAESRASRFRWTSDVNSLHVTVAGPPVDDADDAFEITVRRPDHPGVERLRLGRGLERAIVSRRGERDREVLITWSASRQVRILPVLDRAHFPVDDESEVEELPEGPARSLPAHQLM